MTRVHDMGGRFGDGAVAPEEESVIFHADWHPRAMAVTVATGPLGQWNLDMSRHARERLAPEDYTRFSYYEKWMAALANLLVEQGLVTRDELIGAADAGPSPLADRVLTRDRVAEVLARGGPVDRPSAVRPMFAAGDAVVTRAQAENAVVPGGHTRLPAYAAGARGAFCGCTGHMFSPTAMRTGWARRPSRFMRWSFPRPSFGRIRNTPVMRWWWTCWQSYLRAAP